MSPPSDPDTCILCGARLPVDRRWAITRLLNPRFPRCTPPTEACYRGLAARLGITNLDDERVREVMRRARGE